METLSEKYQRLLISQVKNNGEISSLGLANMMGLRKEDACPELVGTEEGEEMLPTDDYIPTFNIEKVQALKNKLQNDIDRVEEQTDREKSILERKHINFDEAKRLTSMADVANENLKNIKEQTINSLISRIRTVNDVGGDPMPLENELKNIDANTDVERAKSILNKLDARLEKTKADSISDEDYQSHLKFIDEHNVEICEKLLADFGKDLESLKCKGSLSVISGLNNEFKTKLNGGFEIKAKIDEIEQNELIEDAKELIGIIDDKIESHSHILKHSLGIHPDNWDMESVPVPLKKPIRIANLLGDSYFKPQYKNQIELSFGDKKIKYSLDEINNLETVPNELYDNSKTYMENFNGGITKRRPILDEERKKWVDEINSKVKMAMTSANKIYVVKKDLANGLFMLRTLANDNKWFRHYHSV